jgi:hypothetical protein
LCKNFQHPEDFPRANRQMPTAFEPKVAFGRSGNFSLSAAIDIDQPIFCIQRQPPRDNAGRFHTSPGSAT